MALRLPFVSRDRYDEMKAELRRQIDERTAEAHRWQDLFTEKAAGRRIHAGPENGEATPSSSEPVAELDNSPVARAKRAIGVKAKARDIVRYLENESAKDFAAATIVTGPPDPPKPTSEAAREMEQAIETGRAAAK